MSLRALEVFRGGTKPVCVVKAPPGSGKTQLLVDDVPRWVRPKSPVLVVALTNEQVDDVCDRIGRANPRLRVVRFTGADHVVEKELPTNVTIARSRTDLPREYDVIVGTTAKLALGGRFAGFNVMFVDEAWQIAFKDLLPLTRFAERLVMIGDPGQIPPVRTVPHLRWDVAPYRPGEAMPEPWLRVPGLAAQTERLELETCLRLPHDSVDLVKLFYDFDFRAVARPGERFLRATGSRAGDALDQALLSLNGRSTALISIPTDEEIGIDVDAGLAAAIARAAVRVLKQTTTVRASAKESVEGRALTPADVGICATHRAMNAAIRAALPPKLLAKGLVVETPERWQGQQRPVMLVAHPLSGVEHPSGFDLETGRLCVMASRHQSALVVFSRDHVADTLATHIPSAGQSPGLADAVGAGHATHSAFWEYHVNGRMFSGEVR